MLPEDSAIATISSVVSILSVAREVASELVSSVTVIDWRSLAPSLVPALEVFLGSSKTFFSAICA